MDKYKNSYAGRFLDYLDQSLVEKEIATEHKRLDGGYRGVGPQLSGVYRLAQRPDLALHIIALPDEKWNARPMEWAIIFANILPYSKVEDLNDGDRIRVDGRRIPRKGVGWEVTSDSNFPHYSTFSELEAEILEDVAAGLRQ